MKYLRVSVATWTIELTSEAGQVMCRTVKEEGPTVCRQLPGFVR